MSDSRELMNIRKLVVAGAAIVALVAGATVASAQSREGRWQFTLGTVYQTAADLKFDGGSTLETDDEFGLLMTTGYNISDSLAASFGFGWSSVGYDAQVVKDDASTVGISGTYDTWNMTAGLVFNLMEGPLTPYVGAGIGWTWIDTNIPNGLPQTGCWWDPWYGYICSTYYPTKNTDAFTYQATLGLRYDFNPSSFMRLGYVSQWMDIGEADGTPRFDVVALDFGWMF